MILPDTVIRVFVQHFEDSRAREEAVPILRWKLKKSVPSKPTRRSSPTCGKRRAKRVDVVIALAGSASSGSTNPSLRASGCIQLVLSSSLAPSLSLKMRSRRSLRASRVPPTTRSCAKASCAAIVVRTAGTRPNLTPQMLLEEIFLWRLIIKTLGRKPFQSVRVAGLGARLPEFARPLEDEFHCDVRSLLHSVSLMTYQRRCPSAGGSRIGRFDRLNLPTRLESFIPIEAKEGMKVRLNLATKALETHRRSWWVLVSPCLCWFRFSWAGMHVYSARKSMPSCAPVRKEPPGDGQTRNAAQGPERYFSQKDIANLHDRAAFINTILDARSFNWTLMFMDLERILPAGVRVISIEPRQVAGASK